MSPSQSPFDDPTTEQEFQECLISLIRAAHANGVDVEGGWAGGDSREDSLKWGVEIFEVMKRPSPHDVG